MKIEKTCLIVLFLLFGVLPTIIGFATHDTMCKYDMNPLCYLECILPLILASPLLGFAVCADEL